MIRKFCAFLLLILISAGTGKGIYYSKGGFSCRRIHSLDHWVQENWSEEANGALKQSFRYLGRGRQCFAFVSEDGNYVLKLPRTDIYQTPFWLKVIPLKKYRAKLEVSHKKREMFILNSVKISSDELREQTGIIATHLGKSFSLGTLTVIDKMGCKHHLPIRDTTFILQYKHPILMREFAKTLEKGDGKESEKIIDALLAVIVDRASRGILNRDRSFLRNYGYDGEKAYQIDVGSFFRNPSLPPEKAYEKSIRDSVDPIQEWLSQYSPEMLDYFNKRLEKHL